MWSKHVALAALVSLSLSQRTEAQGVTFYEAIAAAQEGPRLAGLSEAARIRQSGDRAITALPSDPQLQLMPGMRLAPDGDEGLEFQATLTQSFTLGSLGRSRRRAAEQERRELDMARHAELLTLQLDTAKAWIDAWALSEEHAATERERESVIAVLENVERAVASGERTRRDAAALRVYADQLKISAIDLSARLDAVSRLLSANMGLGPGARARAQGPLPEVGLPELSDVARRLEAVGDLPSVAQLHLASLSANARAAEARAESLSQIQLGISLQADHPGGFVAFGVIGFQPRLAATDARERSAQLAEAARLEGEHAQALRDARRFAEDTLSNLGTARQVEEVLATRLQPSARQMVELEDRAYAAREASVLTVLEARRRLIEAERMLALARAARAWSEVKTWLLLVAMEGDAAPQAQEIQEEGDSQ